MVIKSIEVDSSDVEIIDLNINLESGDNNSVGTVSFPPRAVYSNMSTRFL